MKGTFCLERCDHGGNVWKASLESEVKVNEIIDFSSNVNPLGPPLKVIKAIKENLWRLPFYPDPEYRSLKEKIAEFHGLKKDNVVVGNGSTELLYSFCKAFVKGGEVLIPIPTFGEYEIAAKITGAKVRYVNVGLLPEIDKIVEVINDSTKAVFLCNPNNPTSTLIPKKEVLKLLDVALSYNSFVLLDESYIEFSHETYMESLGDVAQKYPNLLIIRSVTKLFGMAGLRVGYGLAEENLIKALKNYTVPWNVGCLAEVATLTALEDEEFINKTRSFIDKEKLVFYHELNSIDGVEAHTPKVNFMLVDVKNTGISGAKIKEKLIKKGILIRECRSFKGLDDYFIRVSIRRKKENEKLIKSLKEVCIEKS